MVLMLLLFFLLIFPWNPAECLPSGYQAARNDILQSERNTRMGTQLQLNSQEQLVDKMFLTEKANVIKSSRVNGSVFPPAIDFLQSKKLIDQSPVFKMIQHMPKGCVLHIHDASMVSLDWVIKNITYRPNLYICYNAMSGNPSLQFFNQPPENPGCKWELISTERQRFGDIKLFDQQLYNNFTITNSDNANQSVNDVWVQLENYFDLMGGLLRYLPVFNDYIYQALTEFHRDKIQCLEIRTTLKEVYDLDGTIRDSDWVVQTFKDIASKFKQLHPDFFGIKLIYSGYRFLPKTTILADIKKAMRLVEKYPDFVVGYDLVGQEDLGKPLLYYIDELLYPSQQSPPVNLPYFFHGGETDWQNTHVDENLIDAILLNTSRIGHGFAITKHPAVRKIMKEKGIAVEVNPVSNQVLKLVEDMRDHPAAELLSEDFPVVIGSDAPALWGTKPLSHDFYMATMALCGEDSGIGVLKQLALNSIRYSAMTDSEKAAAITSWTKQWQEFLIIELKSDNTAKQTSQIHQEHPEL